MSKKIGLREAVRMAENHAIGILESQDGGQFWGEDFYFDNEDSWDVFGKAKKIVLRRMEHRAVDKEGLAMTPKQETMKQICDLLHADAQKKGMGLDYEMFSKRHTRMKHETLKKFLHNMQNPIGDETSDGR